ncbi:hypothetical protein FIBSPDRAFT_868103 [Athelia psychrophila]|uniref:Uncharacterized protein n=1 Tax=Athelia psychrophila TaxID=1759441 RepID=A0A166DDH3_9AGAM|nr:hypothetical protein FIBSPDRAFT_868103 [Fibularhizoctonia sp. CBS 109695]
MTHDEVPGFPFRTQYAARCKHTKDHMPVSLILESISAPLCFIPPSPVPHLESLPLHVSPFTRSRPPAPRDMLSSTLGGGGHAHEPSITRAQHPL